MEEFKRRSEAQEKVAKPKFKKGEKEESRKAEKEEIYPSLATGENTEEEKAKGAKKSKQGE